MAEDIKDQETADESVEKAEESVETAEESGDAKASSQAEETAETPAEEAAAEEAAAKEAAAEEAAAEEAAAEEAAAEEAAAEEAAAPPEEAVRTEEAVASSNAPEGKVAGVAAFFDHPEHLIYAAAQARDAKFEKFDALSPFPIHGMDDAMGLGRSWIPWVTFGAGCAGLTTAASLQFGIMGFDWPMIYGGRPFIAWPSFVPIMFELTVLFAGVTTGIVMLIAAGCFRKPLIIDRQITNDRFALWIAADDKKFDRDQVVEFMKGLNPTEIRTVRKDGN